MQGWRKKVAWGAAIAALCTAVLVSRALYEGKLALSRGDQAMAAGEANEAIRWWRRAARWYVPLAGHTNEAYDRLRELATSSEPAISLVAWRSIRRSVIATRSFYRPHQSRLAEANREIARLMAAQDTFGAAAEQSLEEREQFHLRLLERPVGVSVLWALIAALGLVVWLGGAFYFALRGIDDEDQIVRRAALIAASAVMTGLVLWSLGLHLA